MGFHRLAGDAQLSSDAPRRFTPCDQPEHLAFALGEVVAGAGTADVAADRVPAQRPSGTPEQRALLERLANGETIAAAAAAEFLSLRTANRRIAQAREALGVRTTREAVLAYLRQRRSS